MKIVSVFTAQRLLVRHKDELTIDQIAELLTTESYKAFKRKLKYFLRNK